jgi:hypothetical protein
MRQSPKRVTRLAVGAGHRAAAVTKGCACARASNLRRALWRHAQPANSSDHESCTSRRSRARRRTSSHCVANIRARSPPGPADLIDVEGQPVSLRRVENREAHLGRWAAATCCSGPACSGAVLGVGPGPPGQSLPAVVAPRNTLHRTSVSSELRGRAQVLRVTVGESRRTIRWRRPAVVGVARCRASPGRCLANGRQRTLAPALDEGGEGWSS